MPQYRATAAGFFGGCMYGPNQKRQIISTAEPLNPIPSWMEPINSSTPEAATPATGGKPRKKKGEQTPETPVSFISDDDTSTDTPESL